MNKRALSIAVIAILAFSACGGGGDGSATTTGAPATTVTTAAPAEGGVHAGESSLGAILVDGDGFTLYVFTADAPGESTCFDSCAATWPPVPADTVIGPGLDGSLFGSTTRPDGSEQLTVDGQPLYRYAPDTNPGDVNGQGVGGVWFVVGADGHRIEGAEGAATSTSSDYGLDY